jgi:tetratricopeptide (TPR) repeat protein
MTCNGYTASLNLLFHLGRRLEGSRILLLGAYRASEVTEAHPLAPVVTEFKRRLGKIQLDLEPFDPLASRSFVDALLDSESNHLNEQFRERLFWHTKGHPLFTIELLRDMQERGNLVKNEQGVWVEGQKINWDTLPVRAEAVIEGRIGRLEDQLRDILTIAAVEGEEFTAQVIAHITKMDEWPLLRRLSQELEGRHRLIREREEIETGTRRLSRYQFGHVLFQQYLYRQVGLAERRLLHGQIAHTLENLYAGHTDDITVQLAHHYREAGQHPKAIEYARHAAHRAEAMYAYDQAAEHLRAALTLIAPDQQSETRLTVLEQLADIYALLGERPRAIQFYQNALDLWHGLPDADKMMAVRLHRKICEMVVYMTWFADRQRFEAIARASFATALKMTQDEPPHPETVHLLTTISTDAWLSRQPADWDVAEYYARAAVIMAETLDMPVELSLALENLTAVYGARGLLRERVEISLQRLELSRKPGFGNPRERAKILRQTGFALVQVGEYTQAMPYLLEAETLSHQVQALDQEFRALRWQQYCWVRLDQWDKVFEIDTKWRNLEARSPNFAERVGPTCFLIALAASVHALRGNLEQANTLRNEALATMIANDGPPDGWQRNNRY